MIVFGAIFLVSILYKYNRSPSGLTKGTSIIAFIALTLLLMPNARNVAISIAGNEVSVIKEEKFEKSKFIIESLEQQVDRLNLLLREKSRTILRLQNATESEPNATLAEIKKETPPATYEITLKEILFNEICETSNDTGEFYYSFLINGATVVDRSLSDRIQKTKDTRQILTGARMTVKSYDDDEGFNLSGFIKEYDGKTLFRTSIKTTTVGEISERISFKEESQQITIGNDNSTCYATLTIEIVKLSDL